MFLGLRLIGAHHAKGADLEQRPEHVRRTAVLNNAARNNSVDVYARELNRLAHGRRLSWYAPHPHRTPALISPGRTGQGRDYEKPGPLPFFSCLCYTL